MTDDTGTFRGDTLRPQRNPTPSGAVRVPALTIAFHADVRRIGDRLRLSAVLLGDKVGVARLETDFRAADETRTGPLKDPYLSRSPVWFHPDADGVRIDASQTSTDVRVAGERVDGSRTVTHADIERGVVIELMDRVVLLLHLLRPPGRVARRHGLVGQSDAVEELRAEIDRVAGEDVAVLLRGESGTGKELVAGAVHRASRRASGPFVAVNMGAIPASTASAELFGHSKGAFTGAADAHRGFFGRADRGTLFLDEIGETPDEVQPLLLRALETGDVQSVGGKCPTKVDVRVVAATDADLERAIDDGAFRLSLLHRLAGYEVGIPALRERLEDLGVLLVHFLRTELERTGDLELLERRDPKRPPWLRADLVARLLAHDWPGNVRQLRNVARQLVIASRGEEQVRINRAVERLLPAPVAPSPPPPAQRRGRTNLDDISDEHLIETLRANRWRIAASARALGVSKNSLYQLMERSSRITKAKDLTADAINAAGEELCGDVTLMAERLEVSRRGLLLRMRELGLG